MFAVMCFLIVFISSAAAKDQGENDKTESRKLETLTVTANRLTTREDLAPDSLTNLYRTEKSAKAGTEIFTPEDIKNIQPKDINDLLNTAVGLNVTYQGRRSPYLVSQRGGGSCTYILDGAVLPPSSNRILYKIPMSAIEEIKVVRGSTSLTLGPSIPIGASGSGSGLNTGYIIIRTKRPEKTEAVLKASIEKGTGGHPTAHKESVFLGTEGTFFSSLEGYFGGLIANMDKPSKDTWFDGQDSRGEMGVTGFRAGKFSLNMMTYHDSGCFEMQRGIDEDGIRSDVKWYYDPLKTTVYSGDMAMAWTSHHITLLNSFHTRYEQAEHNESFVSDTASMREYEEKTKGLGLRHHARFGGTLFQIGAQMSNSTGFGPNTKNKYNKYDTTVTGWSGSLEQRLFSGRLVIDGGYREDTKHIDNSSTSDEHNDVQSDVDMSPSKVFAIGSHYIITNMFTFDGRFFHGEQGTSGDFDIRAETGTLHHEKQDRIELTVSANPAPYVKPALTWFSVDMKNKKSATSATYETDTGTYYYYTESDELRRGLELMVSGSIGKGTSYKASWTHMLDSKSTEDGVTTDSLGTSNPENLYTLILTQKWLAYRANLSIKTVTEWEKSSSPRGTAEGLELGDYTRVDINIQRDFTIKDLMLNITLYGRNIAAENYATRYVTGYYYDRGCILGTEITLRY